MKKLVIRLVGVAALALLLTSPAFAGSNWNQPDCDVPSVPEVTSTVVLFGMSAAGLMIARKRAQ